MTLPLPGNPVDDFNIQQKFDEIAMQFPIGAKNLASALAVTSLPATPVNGQEIYYVADATNGIVWHLKYRSASASAYKWEYVGGPPLEATGNGQVDSSGTTYTSLTTALTVPLAGDWDVDASADMFNNTASATGSLMANTSTTDPGLAANLINPAGETTITQRLDFRKRLTGLTAGATVTMYSKASAGVTRTVNRYLRLRPVRVG